MSNKNIIDDVLSQGVFAQVANNFGKDITTSTNVVTAVNEQVQQPEPQPEPKPQQEVSAPTPQPEPITESADKDVNQVDSVLESGAFNRIATAFVNGVIEKSIINTDNTAQKDNIKLKNSKRINRIGRCIEGLIKNDARKRHSNQAPEPQKTDDPSIYLEYISGDASRKVNEAIQSVTEDSSLTTVDSKIKALELKMHKIASMYSGGGTNGGGRHGHAEVTVLSGEHTADVEALSADIADIKTNGVAGFDVTGAFLGKDAGAGAVWTSTTGIEYTSEQAASEQVITFSMDSSIQSNTDNPYWTNPTPAAHTGVGLFGGSYLPDNVSPIFNFTEVDPDTFEDGTNVPTTGRISLSGCSFGDQLRLRFDLIVIPQITNTTVTPMLWYKNRTQAGVVTYSFELPTQPIFFGQGTVGKEYLNRVEISAWIANEEDVHALVYPAMKADNPCIVKPNSMMATILR